MRYVPLLLLVLLPLMAMGCKSQEKPVDERPVEVEQPAAEPEPEPEPEPDDGIPPGHVQINKRKADLVTEILPDFARQSGVRIRYEGEPLLATLQLFQPTPWRDALDILCQFSRLKRETSGTGAIILTAKKARKIRSGAAAGRGGGGLGSTRLISRGERVDVRSFMKMGEPAVVEFTADW